MSQQEWVKSFLSGLWVDEVTDLIRFFDSEGLKNPQQEAWGLDSFSQRLHSPSCVRGPGLFPESVL